MREIADLYPKATHYCWAYRFCGNIPVEHSSDAGEPSGTAGRPILGALKKYSLLNVMAVVTRYYGGVKLGVKGLIAAYGEVTLHAIENANIIQTEPFSRIIFTCSYELYNLFLSRLSKNSIAASDISAQFTDIISGEIIVPNSKFKLISSELDSLSLSEDSFSYTIE
jgi:putative IMPACT (imprinted ancient) family translation regulator